MHPLSQIPGSAPGGAHDITLVITSAAASAADVADFYRGKNLRIYVGYGPGTGYDVNARLLGRHFAKHLPGKPGVVIQNMPGAASLTMTNYMYNVADRDGTAIGLPARNLFVEPLFGNANARFDARKFTWLGSMSTDVALCFTWHNSGVATIQDAMKREVLVGSSGVNSGSYIFPQILNAMIGTKLKVVMGYPDSAAVGIAMERGEVAGYCSFTWASIKSARPKWIEDKQINILLQLTIHKHAGPRAWITHYAGVAYAVTAPHSRSTMQGLTKTLDATIPLTASC